MEKHAKQLHIRMSHVELERTRDLAGMLGMTMSDLVRALVQAPAWMIRPEALRHGEAPSGCRPPGDPSSSTLIVMDRDTAVRLRRELRRWGHHYNQAVHALNAIAYYLRLDEADATDAIEELTKANRKLDSMNDGVAALRRDVAEISAHPIAYL